MDGLKDKARNYFLLGVIAESLGMPSEAAANYFKALLAIDDAALLEQAGISPKDYSERFEMLKAKLPRLYTITDRLFGSYRRTYTQDLKLGEVEQIKKRVMEAFENARTEIPTNEEVKKRFEELLKKGKIFG